MMSQLTDNCQIAILSYVQLTMFVLSLLLISLFCLYVDVVECLSAIVGCGVFLIVGYINNVKWVYVLKPIEPP